MGERVPQHVQNIVLRNYCAQNSFTLLLSASEYAMEGSFLILKQAIKSIADADGLLLYSLFQLPDNDELREKIIFDLLSQKKSIHFAVEGLTISDQKSYKRCDTIWRLKKTMTQTIQVQTIGTA